MNPWITIMTSALTGILSLVGVVVGFRLNARSQQRAWYRDRQIEVCQAVVATASEMQIGLARKWQSKEPIDWIAWNQALSGLWLIGSEKVRKTAMDLDQTLWEAHSEIRQKKVKTSAEWGALRQSIESAQLTFINAARHEVALSQDVITEVPSGRPADRAPRHDLDGADESAKPADVARPTT